MRYSSGRALGVIVLVVGAVTGLGSAAIAASSSFPTVPKAHCGAGSLPETGLQGEVPLADQFDGRSQKGYRCNLELRGEYQANGGALMLAWHGHCAYMPTGYAATDPDFNKEKGVIVVDVSNPAHPVETTRLQTPAMVNPWEALKANDKTGLLATGEGGSFPLAGPGAAGPVFDVYDVNHDCAHPKLDASLSLPHAHGHEGDFAPDGRTYYQSSLQGAPNTSIDAIDLTNPKKPRELTHWASKLGPVHAVQISPDGNRAFFMVAAFNGSSLGNDGLVIADTSEVQARKPHAQIHVISHLFWRDGAEAQIARYVRIKGHPYLITTDEFGAQASPHQACANGENPFGFVHIVDIGNEKHPKLINTIRLQVNDPANCATVLPEAAYAPLSLLYSSHYCTADNPMNTTAIACTWISSGVRVFDVRDPMHPREIAYYNPPARIDPQTIRGSAPIFDALVGLRTHDSTSTQVRWVRDAKTGQEDLWFISAENGFQVLTFTNGVYPLGAHAKASSSGKHHEQSVLTVGSISALPDTGGTQRPVLVGLALMLTACTGGALLRRRRAGERPAAPPEL